MRRIMVISAGWEQEPLIREARKMGLWVLAADANKNACSFSLADKSQVLNPRDLGGCLRVARENSIDAVIADQCDYSIFASAFVAESLGLPGPRIRYARVADKGWLRSFCKTKGVIQPEFRIVMDFLQAREAARSIGFPVVVKPVDNRGAFGTKIVDGMQDLNSAYLEALANSHSRQVIVEKKIEGLHLTVDGFGFGPQGHASLAIASKDILAGPRPIVSGVYYPAKIPCGISDEVRRKNDKLIETLGIEYGATHVEYILDKNEKPYLLEVAARGGGVHTASKIIPAITGINISQLLIRWALGEKLNCGAGTKGRWNAAYLGFIVLNPGRIKRIKGADTLKDMPGLLHFQLLVKEGDTLSEVKSGAHRHGFYIIAAENLDTALKKSRKITSLLEIEYQNK